ncbi:hypothetical protein K438DRAFT_1992037 [Mycena galopus ATCC 62051]|nr:hypothetical protein K438DRAFT_1992037 [Mycena galopus ATCC 62051]
MPNPGPPPPDIAHLNPASYEFRHRQWLGRRLRPSHDSDSHPGLGLVDPFSTPHPMARRMMKADLAGILCHRRSSSYLSEKADGLVSVPPRCLKVPVMQRLFSRTPLTTVCIFAPHFLCIEGEDSPPAQRIHIVSGLVLSSICTNDREDIPSSSLWCLAQWNHESLPPSTPGFPIPPRSEFVAFDRAHAHAISIFTSSTHPDDRPQGGYPFPGRASPAPLIASSTPSTPIHARSMQRAIPRRPRLLNCLFIHHDPF